MVQNTPLPDAGALLHAAGWGMQDSLVVSVQKSHSTDAGANHHTPGRATWKSTWIPECRTIPGGCLDGFEGGMAVAVHRAIASATRFDTVALALALLMAGQRREAFAVPLGTLEE